MVSGYDFGPCTVCDKTPGVLLVLNPDYEDWVFCIDHKSLGHYRKAVAAERAMWLGP